MSASRILTHDQIDVLEEHLPYELQAVEAALAAWAKSPGWDDNDPEMWFRRISAIESFWVHARILQEFFTKTEVRAASADHFTNDRTHYDIPDVEKVQQQIVHLNYGRPRGNNSEKLGFWFAQHFLGCVDRAVLKFQCNLIDDAKKYWKMRGAMTIPTPTLTPQSTNHIWSLPAGPNNTSLAPKTVGLPTLPSPE